MSPIITPTLLLRDSSPETTFQHVATRLEKLAEETDSFIAIQHQDPNSEGTTVFFLYDLWERKVA